MTAAPAAPSAHESTLPAGLETAYEPLAGSMRLSSEGRRIVVRYVAIDPWPPTHFFPVNGLRGKLDGSPMQGALPLVRDGDRLRQAADGEAAERWWQPPAHLDTTEAQAMLDPIMEAYAAWKAGELCGCVTETFVKTGRGWGHSETSVEWRHYSPSQAQMELDAIEAAPEPALAPAP